MLLSLSSFSISFAMVPSALSMPVGDRFVAQSFDFFLCGGKLLQQISPGRFRKVQNLYMLLSMIVSIRRPESKPSTHATASSKHFEI
eukprot:COSAG02_NODE_4640_length_5141_cov_2.504760_4_plen_87_part_00